MASHRSIDYTYPSLIYQLRTAHLTALGVQSVTLYLWSRQLGLVTFLVPFIFLCLNFYLVFKRWYYSIDGRYDFQQLFQKTVCLSALFGSFILALVAHFLGPELEGGVTSLLYNLSNYTSITVAFCIMVVDSFEGYKSKNA